jgi:hypothetical protein
MTVLSESEQACLKSIARGSPAIGADCSGHTLQLLESLELIEKAPRIWLPWLLERNSYRLTAQGRRVLARL